MTLIELLVVTTVLSVLAVGASLTAIRNITPAPDADMAWFRTQFDTQRNLAIQGRATRGLRITAQGLGFARRTATGWQINAPTRAWAGKVTIANVEPRLVAGSLAVPDLIMLATGQSSAFDVVFTDGAASTRRCRSDGWTGLTCDAK
ncbi:prepilin-type N-terminal cleavage/methylation domain-containing protein [Sulfitobacter sp. TSTF-M16]|uniref:Prepilin-type N-terminal cleavage/methylation domain-containing protein n=1 Tax=Sulfitobacter aestuariivivens TaxID=2766981 RepID=A0A927D7F2_9RHOB|nr:prepilin-type N-terminal cleavage/methylation domain-containing protein [Sulfitobacter aestuariivivens]